MFAVAFLSIFIGTNNFFELKLAAAIFLSKFTSGAAQAAVVGILINPR